MARARRRVARRVDRPHRQRAAPDDSVTPLALNVFRTGVAVTQVVPSALTWIVSPAPSVPVNVPLTVCDATFVM